MTFNVETSVTGRVIPESLRERDIWVLWDGDDKTAKAPWETGHMYPAEWTDASGERVTRPFEKAKMVADMPVEAIADSYPFPDGDTPEEVLPTVLLPEHADDYDPALMLVDMDDVRDPETGEITKEAAEIVGDLGSYTEVSKSGTGLHVYVWATLPGGLKRFIQSLNDEGDIEMYDHGRLSAATWRHVKHMPTEVTEGQDVVENIIEEYASDEQTERRDEHDPMEEARERARQEADLTGSSGSSRNSYYQLDTYDIARQDGSFAAHESGMQGPHPAHGAQSGAAWDSESTNFTCERDGVWHCFLHGSGGGPLDLIAVMEGVVSCDYFEGRRLEDDPELLLKACLYAKEEYAPGTLEGETPPHKALVAIAEEYSLEVQNDGSLTKDAYRVASKVFESMEPGALQ